MQWKHRDISCSIWQNNWRMNRIPPVFPVLSKKESTDWSTPQIGRVVSIPIPCGWHTSWPVMRLSQKRRVNIRTVCRICNIIRVITIWVLWCFAVMGRASVWNRSQRTVWFWFILQKACAPVFVRKSDWFVRGISAIGVIRWLLIIWWTLKCCSGLRSKPIIRNIVK